MINQQLTDFIKQQLQVGLTKEKISSELFANGWNTQDVEEGFKAVGIPIPPAPIPTLTPNPAMIPTLNPTPITTQSLNPNLYSHFNDSNPTVTKVKHSGKGLFFVILIILLLAAGASAYYFKDELIKLPIIKDIFPSKEAVVSEVPVQTDNTQAVIQTEQPDTNSLSVYNDPNGLYSFSYPKGAEIEYGGKYPGIWMTIPQWENSPIITIFSDINNVWFNSSIKTPTLTSQKSSLGNIDAYPVYKYSPSKSSLNDYSATYVIDLGNYNNTNLSIVFTVITNEQGPNLADQIEKIVKSFIINKNNIASAIKVMSAKLVENQNYSNDIFVRENIKKILAPAEVYYEKSNSYTGFCKSNEYINATKDIVKPTILNCKDSTDAYSVMAPISSGYWCVDSTGYNNTIASLDIGTTCVK